MAPNIKDKISTDTENMAFEELKAYTKAEISMGQKGLIGQKINF